MIYSRDTTLAGPSAGSADYFFKVAQDAGSARLDWVRQYLDTVYQVAPAVGLRAEIVVVQSIHETSAPNAKGVWIPWNSYWWIQRANPAGIGINGNPPDDNASRVFGNGVKAALAQLTHLYLYAKGTALPEQLKADYDPRWDIAVDAGRAGVAKTLLGLANSWAMDSKYADKITEKLNSYDLQPIEVDSTSAQTPATTPGKGPIVATTAPEQVTFKRVPMYGYVDRQFVTANKPEGFGWDNLGKRDVLGVVWHRMLGSLLGTDQFFGLASTGALTDYGIGVTAQDGAALNGYIYKWNNEYGYRAGWASGRVSAPYGDGLKFVNKYGVNAVNVRLVSLETSGFEGTPIDAFALNEIVHFIAYYADQAGIRFDEFPFYKVTGMSFLFWHQEFTIGTGKKCPFDYVMSITNQVIGLVAAFLKKYQTAGDDVPVIVPPVVPPIVIPAPTFAAPKPITGLALLSDADVRGHRSFQTAEGSHFSLRMDKLRVVDPERFYLQWADKKNAPRTKPDPKVDDLVDGVWSVVAADKEEYYIDNQWARIPASSVVIEED